MKLFLIKLTATLGSFFFTQLLFCQQIQELSNVNDKAIEERESFNQYYSRDKAISELNDLTSGAEFLFDTDISFAYDQEKNNLLIKSPRYLSIIPAKTIDQKFYQIDVHANLKIIEDRIEVKFRTSNNNIEIQKIERCLDSNGELKDSIGGIYQNRQGRIKVHKLPRESDNAFAKRTGEFIKNLAVFLYSDNTIPKDSTGFANVQDVYRFLEGKKYNESSGYVRIKIDDKGLYEEKTMTNALQPDLTLTEMILLNSEQALLFGWLRGVRDYPRFLVIDRKENCIFYSRELYCLD